MAKDIRVILIKLADRLHNMRTLSYLGKEKQIDKSKETLEVYAPLAHRLGIESIRWELEDLAFATLHPRKYAEVQRMVARDGPIGKTTWRRRGPSSTANCRTWASSGDRGEDQALLFHLRQDGAQGQGVSTRSTTSPRSACSSPQVKDCYAALGIIHSIWKPLPGRFKDYVAMPKFNMYQSLHTTVIDPWASRGDPIRTYEMHETAQYGIAAHWVYKEGRTTGQKAQGELEKTAMAAPDHGLAVGDQDSGEFMDALRIDLFHDEVYVFTPKGAVKSLPAGSTPVDFAYAIHTDVGHHCVGAKVDGRIVPSLQAAVGRHRGDPHLQDLQGPSRDWLQFVASSGARNKIRQWFKRERREDSEHLGARGPVGGLQEAGAAAQKLIGSDLIAEVMKETNHVKREDFFIAVGSGKISPQHVVQKIIQILNREGETTAAAATVMSLPSSAPKEAREAPSSADMGIRVDGIEDVAIRIPQCCRPVPETIGWAISHLAAASPSTAGTVQTSRRWRRTPRVRGGPLGHSGEGPLRVEIQVEAYERNRLLEDISRTLSESGVSIAAAQIFTARNNMVKGPVRLRCARYRIPRDRSAAHPSHRHVYDAYRVTPH